jgi:hypothetical protein
VTVAGAAQAINGLAITNTVTNQAGSSADAIVNIDGGNGTNFVFNGYNAGAAATSVIIRFAARNFNIGDTFSITNQSHNIRLLLNPIGFSNINTSGISKAYVLESQGISTALIMITAGATPRDKNINIMFSANPMTGE